MSQTKAQLLNPLNGNLNVTGVVTASSFVGNVNAGVVTASSISVSGNVSIAGTLTYEDVTNVDSIGIITARSGIEVLAGGINAVGVVTASSISVGGQTVSTLGVGIRTEGSISGYGATMIDFRGPGISTVTVGSGIGTINVSGGPSGGVNPLLWFNT